MLLQNSDASLCNPVIFYAILKENENGSFTIEEKRGQFTIGQKLGWKESAMKENRYDDEIFFQKYSQMDRSKKGLSGAGEWRTFQSLLPDLTGKRVLDLGCGYGWHCIYAMEQGAASAVGIDLSEKMLAVAREKTKFPQVQYRCCAIEDFTALPESFDIVLSSLALHYIESFETVAQKVRDCLVKGGDFIFSVEHPVFTAYGNQDWYYGENGEILHFPVDRYFYEGKRQAVFLGEKIEKYHRTLTTYLDGLLQNGFSVRRVAEPQPPKDMWDIPGMKDEMRRPMMLIVAAKKE